ncbi:S8 family peptidase [Vallitalea okinawensis]|uniref:S8 family peptidase n=1 Tax=Vallitalea okinawensis TaxID=2078660 RepID=UPI000CFB85D6|nr:S8 family peptidase [Vallitalea okinawensis]
MRQDIDCHEIITSEDYLDIWYRYKGDFEEVAKEAGAICAKRVFEDWILFHIKMGLENCQNYYLNSEYIIIPNVYGLSSISSIEAAGIGPVLKSKALDITGNGVIIALIDTGIDYTHEAFRYEDNTSKIISIWDQTEAGIPPKGFLYGTEYTNNQITEAINSDDPLSIVPTMDEIGHGTFLAGIAAGRPNYKEKFQGAAPDADLVIVKLKQAKKCLREFFQVKEDAIAYQTSDMLQGVNYVLDKAEKLGKPIVVLLAFASSDGPHNGTNEFEEILAKFGDSIGAVMVTTAGNEANADHHFHGIFKEGKNKLSLDFNIAEKEEGVFLNMWVPLPDQLSIELISPSGTTTGVFRSEIRRWQKKVFPIESSVIRVHYDLLEERAAEESIAIIIEKPLPGLWTIVVHGEILINGEFDIYLPIRGFIEDNTVFLSPDPDSTVVIPSTNPGTITVGAYNEVNNSIYLSSGRGYTRDLRIKPDIVAPGVNVIGPYLNNQYGTMTGTSVATALTAGASALLLEWGIVQGNNPNINTMTMKTYLSRGAKRRKGMKYPNKEWGYGELDLLNTLNII